MIEFKPKSRKWVFEDLQGNTYDGNVPEGKDPDDLCCKMVRDFHMPFKCYPKIIESSSGLDRGEIII